MIQKLFSDKFDLIRGFVFFLHTRNCNNIDNLQLSFYPMNDIVLKNMGKFMSDKDLSCILTVTRITVPLCPLHLKHIILFQICLLVHYLNLDSYLLFHFSCRYEVKSYHITLEVALLMLTFTN